MYKDEFLEKIDKELKKWRQAHQAEIEAAEKGDYATEDEIPLKPLYTPLDMQELDVIFQLIVDSYNFVTGRTVSATDMTAAA